MDSEKVELQAFVIGMSSVLKLHHRKAKLPASLTKIVKAAIEAYWEDGSFQGFSKIMAERIVEVAIKETVELRAIPEKLYDEKAHAEFMAALYQEIFSFFELCFMDDYRYLAHVFDGSASITVIFTREPCVVTYVADGPFNGVYKVSSVKKLEDGK